MAGTNYDHLKHLPTVFVCAGPPTCELAGDKAVENAEAGCPNCERIAVHPDGSTESYRLPKH